MCSDGEFRRGGVDRSVWREDIELGIMRLLSCPPGPIAAAKDLKPNCLESNADEVDKRRSESGLGLRQDTS